MAITRQQLSIDQRVSHTAALFGVRFPMQFEPYVYTVTSALCRAYQGGYWHFYALSNGGFYMAPNSNALYLVACENGYAGNLSADALGITASLYTYSHLSFSAHGVLAETYAQHYHWLRDYMLGHPEAFAILAAID